jgi:DNA-binding GntR family transcriptional regulator
MPRRYEQTYRFVNARLRERIDQGEWLPGEALPSMRKLAEEYTVSLDTVQKAVGLLADDGLVEVVPGFGVFRAQ